MGSNQDQNTFNGLQSAINNHQENYMFSNQEANPFEASFQESKKAVEAANTQAHVQALEQKTKSSSNDKSSQADEDAEAKRLKFLERNRIAASKCRQKKKLWMQQLAAQADQAAARNKTLQMMVNQLKDEVLVLKNQLLAHRNCNCNVIQQYIQTSGQFNSLGARPMNNMAPMQQPGSTLKMINNVPGQHSDPNNLTKGN